MGDKPALQPIIENVSVEKQVELETSERVFARFCQLLSSNDGEIRIPFDKYDEIDNSEEVKLFEKSIPAFFGIQSRANLRACSVVERFLGEQVNAVEEFIGGIVNPALLRGKSLRCKEDADNEVVVFRLASE